MRLNKFIAANSKYSRRKADELIESGEVTINGKTAELGAPIDPKKDQIVVAGQEVSEINSEKIYLALNKPPGFITTRSDEFKRKTVMDLAPKIPNLKPVGRLDKNSQGLILLSNDGEFINRITHPKFECEKEYLIEVYGSPSDAKLHKLEQGVVIEGKKTAPAKIRFIKETRETTTLRIILREGRNRQIRKMFASISHPVKYLERLRIGNISLGSLPIGKFRNLSEQEINVK